MMSNKDGEKRAELPRGALSSLGGGVFLGSVGILPFSEALVLWTGK
jgi:hypothetical protein